MINAQMCFIGGGNMANSIISGLISDNIDASSITVVDPNEAKLNFLNQHYHVNVTESLEKGVRSADIILLCVKPQVMGELLIHLKHVLEGQKTPFLISIAAGVPIDAIMTQLGQQVPIVRAMPNTPSIIGCGATALYASEQVSRQQREISEQIMRKVGVVTWVQNEQMMDVVTAISGSGPAYFFYMIEALIASAKEAGLTDKQATLLVTQTAFGASKMALESHDIHTLRQNVTSKKGATDAAIATLESHDFAESIAKAVQANIARSKELAKLFDKALTHQN
ncbi:pyrroline-5-carboxylate reductase [Fangia hongkongensis]|uniref:pyrroline-5-carboxylate reductase n=1 Tax=Fangia hongkongensis TaxID=270495 RepID=UPI00036B9FFD|nr:pyrroline-5-carboxylate reductase [Fangia hongkongensis]MBK2124592.1 pyrroline-5-carboxylate reductase [Fangia hongkongensis]